MGATGITGDDFTVYLEVASDYVFRGTSQTRERPALQLGVDFEHPSGLFAGIWASNVDFPPVGPFEDEREIEIQGYAGYGFELGEGWGLAVSLVRYDYPGADDVIDWDYTEIGVSLLRDATSLSLAYSDSALGSGEGGLAVELADRRPLLDKLALAVGLGYYDLDSHFLEDYFYWSAELSRPVGRFTLELGYFDSDSRAEELWGERSEARLVASVAYRIH